MKDDYLWDGSGEADPEVEELELLLGRLRYEPKPLELPAPPRRAYWPHVAAAAVIVMTLAAGLWFYLQRQSGVESPESRVEESNMAAHPQNPNESGATSSPKVKSEEPIQKQKEKPGIARSMIRKPKQQPEVEENQFDANEELIAAGARQPIIIPFLDPETIRHIERSQFLLRDFRNLTVSENANVLDVTYERARSKRLLGDNILLRRNAEATGNLPVEDLLGSLEPILLDIANLPEKPAADDVRLIRERIQKREIIATLQVYSAVSQAQ